jgi:hypothetical protein
MSRDNAEMHRMPKANPKLLAELKQGADTVDEVLQSHLMKALENASDVVKELNVDYAAEIFTGVAGRALMLTALAFVHTDFEKLEGYREMQNNMLQNVSEGITRQSPFIIEVRRKS